MRRRWAESWRGNWEWMLPLSKGKTAAYIYICPRPQFSHIQNEVSGFHGLTSHNSDFWGWLITISEGNSKDILSKGSNLEASVPCARSAPHKGFAWITLFASSCSEYWLKLQSCYFAARQHNVWPATCTLQCLIRSLAKSDSKFKNPLTWQRTKVGQPQCWNKLNKTPQVASSILTRNDSLL